MATTVEAPITGVPRVMDVREPRWLERIPAWAVNAGVVLVLIAVSGYLRSYFIGGQFWMDEAITTGIASHSLSQIPGLLRHDGSPPLYYVLLHFWIKGFGASETATHAMSLLFGLLTIPAAFWAGYSLFGRRAALFAATLFAFSPFLTEYAGETRMYELMGLLGILATTAYIHAFVFRRRKYLIMFAICQALMLYTHAWGMFFGAGAVLALIPIWLNSDDRRGLVKDALLAFIGAGILFLPWLPNFIYQAAHTGAPWAPPPRFGAPVLLSRDLLGGDRITVALILALVIGVASLFTKRYRHSRQATLLWALLVLPIATLLLAWLASQITPAFVSRYFAPVLAPILLLAAWGCARAGIVGLVAIILSVVFTVHISSYTPQYKSNMREVSGEMSKRLHPGDLVIVGQPEQVPLTWYYLPGDLHLQFASPLGKVSDPTYMNWVYALKRLGNSKPGPTLDPLLATLRPGQQVLFIRPLTEGAGNWKAAWTLLVRRRSAQFGAILASDPTLKQVAWAPHVYRGACCVADSAVLYRKT
jgi:mannosyltransferase